MSVPKAIDFSPELTFIRFTLARKPLFIQFPSMMERAFLAKRAEDSLTYIELGRELLLAMFAFIMLLAWFFFQPLVSVNDYALVKYNFFPVGMLIITIINANRIPWLRQHFYLGMWCVNLMILYLVSCKTLITNIDSYYSSFASYDQMIAMLLITFGIRFTFNPLLALFCIAGIGSLITALPMGWIIDWHRFLNAYLLYGMVILALAAIMERQERLAFLHERLVNYQANELETLNKQLDKIAHEDALTGIANRRSFDELAEKEWDRAQREQHPLAIVLLDVDYFKRYNDTYGHAAGDDCLRVVARVLRESLMRSSDIVARYGGEEFVVLLPNTDLEGASMVAKRIIRRMDCQQLPHATSRVAAHVTVSIGVTSLTPSTDNSLLEGLKQADEALYYAKGQGRHQYQLYQPTLSEQIVS